MLEIRFPVSPGSFVSSGFSDLGEYRKERHAIGELEKRFAVLGPPGS
jgi:hypothetical protein